MAIKKKVLYLITQSEMGGAQTYVFDLAKNLKDKYEITIGFGEQGDRGELAEKLTQNEIKYYSLPHLKRSVSFLNDFLALFEIVKLIKKIKPDIIHLNSSKISILGSLSIFIIRIFAIRGIRIFIRNIRIIYTAHGWVFNEPLSNFKKTFYLYAEKFTARFKDKIICVSEFDRQVALKKNIAPENKLITIHNGIKPVKFLNEDEARKKLSSLIPSYSLQPTAYNLTIGSIAYLYKTKGFEYLIHAVKILVDSGINIKTIIIGEGEERKELENLIGQLNLENKIFLAGKIENAAELIKAFDVYVSSSVKEGLSYTIIEAMTAGLPIVATKVGGTPELIADEEQGLLVAPADPEKLAREIVKLINNPILSEQLGKNAQEKAEREFTLERMLAKTKELYG